MRFFNGLIFEMRDHGFDAEVAPFERGFCSTSPWIWSFSSALTSFFRAVKADEDDTASESRVLQGAQHAKLWWIRWGRRCLGW